MRRKRDTSVCSRSGSSLAAAVLWAAILGSAALGCRSFDHLDICRVDGDRDGMVSDERIRLIQGRAILVKVSPIDQDGDFFPDDTLLHFKVMDPSVLGAGYFDGKVDDDRCPGPSDVHWYLALYGIAPGSTELVLRVDGEERLRLPVEVALP